MSQRIQFAIVALMSALSVVLIVITIVAPSLDVHLPSDITRACTFGLNLSPSSFLIDWIMGVVYFSIQVCMLLWGLFKIRNLSPKYGVKEEIFLVLALWTVCWIATFCINKIDNRYHFIYKLLYNVNLTVIFTFSVTYWVVRYKSYVPL